jgi:hypothetical protein
MSGGSNSFSARRRAISTREPFWAHCRLRESRFSRSLLRVAQAGNGSGLRPIVASQPSCAICADQSAHKQESPQRILRRIHFKLQSCALNLMRKHHERNDAPHHLGLDRDPTIIGRNATRRPASVLGPERLRRSATQTASGALRRANARAGGAREAEERRRFAARQQRHA